MCGEINGFDLDGRLKHSRVETFDIIANPVHRIMGRWQHLGRKLAALSANSVVLHTANNERNHHGITTDLRIYIDRELLNAPDNPAGSLGASAKSETA